jgi:hypothetical protein
MLMLDSQGTHSVQEVERRPRARVRHVFRRPLPWVGLAILVLALRIAIVGPQHPILDGIGYLAIVLFGAAIPVALWRTARAGSVVPALGNLFLAGFSALGMLVAYVATVGFSRGRQLRRFGRVLLPGVRSSSAWTTARVALGESSAVPPGVADRWRENGKTEHASVAAFARLTLDLMALGAPPTLIAAANQDALDEIRHTELCFSLARSLDGKEMGPGPFPQARRAATLPSSRRLALARLAVDSLVDGALHEGVSARIIAALARRCQAFGIRSVLKEIAADEGRHSANGWAAVAWCLQEGGPAVAEALKGAVRALPRQMRSPLPEAAAGGQWERWGIHGHALEQQEYAAALAHLRQRVQEMTATTPHRAA